MPKVPDSFEGAVAKSIEDWLHTTMPGVASSLGPLPDTVEPSRSEKLERWNLRADQVPPGPMTDALADEALRKVLEEHQSQGKPPPSGETLTQLVAAQVNAVLYPYRKEVYGRGIPRAADKVKEAARYARLAGRQEPAASDLLAASTASGAALALPAPAAALARPDAVVAPAPTPPPTATPEPRPASDVMRTSDVMLAPSPGGY